MQIRVQSDRPVAIWLATIFLICLINLTPSGDLHSQNSGQPDRRLELRGQVVMPENTPTLGKRITVKISGIGYSYNEQKWADSKGRFRFKDLWPATYKLTFLIPAAGEISRTVEVTESFADVSAKVEKQFVFTEQMLEEHTRIVTQATVSVRQLTLSRGVRKEFRRAEERLAKAEVDRAIKHLDKALQEAPDFMEAMNLLGTIYFHRREFKIAESYFRQALEIEPEAFGPMLNLGGVLLAVGRARDSLPYNEEAQFLRPMDPMANAQLGLAHFLEGNDEAGAEFMERTKLLDPAHFLYPRITLAQIHLVHERWQQALEELNEFLELHPDAGAVERARRMMHRAEVGLRDSSESTAP